MPSRSSGTAGARSGEEAGSAAKARATTGWSRAEDRDLRTSDFDYSLPKRLIARRPPPERGDSRLLVVHRGSGELADRRFRDLRELAAPGDALVLNDSRVIPARLVGRKPTGAAAELLLLHPLTDQDADRWVALVRPGGKLKPGRRVVVSDELEVEIEDSLPGGGRLVRLHGGGDPWELIERHGRVPLPPYLGREDDEEDRHRYQTVYAERRGSVAAPTAGLHFTSEMLDRLEVAGVRLVRVTLHVGVGTFRPVAAERPSEHRLHAERYALSPDAAARLEETRAAGGRIWAVGSTVSRVLETVAAQEASGEGGIRPGAGWTDLFIRPPYCFRAVDRLLTNFHLPRSSLLMLVSAFAGHELTMRAYAHAVREEYRFYSYGDAMLIL